MLRHEEESDIPPSDTDKAAADLAPQSAQLTTLKELRIIDGDAVDSIPDSPKEIAVTSVQDGETDKSQEKPRRPSKPLVRYVIRPTDEYLARTALEKG